MRKQFAAVAVALAGAIALAGCTQAQLQQDLAAVEANAAALRAKIRVGATVAAADVREALDGVCANAGAINAGAQNLKSGLLALGNGPKTQQNLAIADKSVAVLAGACNAAPGAAASDLVALFKQGWAAYLAFKGATTAATVAASSGS